jgi:hypothetical protein
LLPACLQTPAMPAFQPVQKFVPQKSKVQKFELLKTLSIASRIRPTPQLPISYGLVGVNPVQGKKTVV